MEIKMILRFLLTMAKIKNSSYSNTDKDVNKEEGSSIAGGIAHFYNLSGNQSVRFLRKLE